MIALSLSAVLIGTLFHFITQTAKLETKLDLAKERVIEKAHLQTRLSHIFTSLDLSDIHPPFYTKEEDRTLPLAFRFDNQIDPDPHFSGPIMAELALKGKQLQLTLFPKEEEKEKIFRKETLLKDVKSCEFLFLGPKTSLGKKEKILPITQELCYRKTWPSSLRSSPSMIKLLIIDTRGEKNEFAFILPVADHLITYIDRGVS